MTPANTPHYNPRIAGLPCLTAAVQQRLLRQCRVTVGGVTYTTLAPDTCTAVADAMQRYPQASRISVRVAE